MVRPTGRPTAHPCAGRVGCQLAGQPAADTYPRSTTRRRVSRGVSMCRRLTTGTNRSHRSHVLGFRRGVTMSQGSLVSRQWCQQRKPTKTQICRHVRLSLVHEHHPQLSDLDIGAAGRRQDCLGRRPVRVGDSAGRGSDLCVRRGAARLDREGCRGREARVRVEGGAHRRGRRGRVGDASRHTPLRDWLAGSGQESPRRTSSCWTEPTIAAS